MIHIEFNPTQLTGKQKEWWDDWQAKATLATKEAILAWEADPTQPIKFDSKLWGDLKDWLLVNVFHDKCAYCETRMARSTYHAEHYRPKGGVKYRIDDQKKLRHATAADGTDKIVDHPGYFWLAYNWRNLLPSCQFCNTSGGKQNQFPVQNDFVLLKRYEHSELTKLQQAPLESEKWPGHYYLQPIDLDMIERPDLLHPYFDHPEDHFSFGKGGVEYTLQNADGIASTRGENSIKVYHLDADALRRERDKEQRSICYRFGTAFIEFLINKGQEREEALQNTWKLPEFAAYLEGNEPYSAAVVAFIRKCFK